MPALSALSVLIALITIHAGAAVPGTARPELQAVSSGSLFAGAGRLAPGSAALVGSVAVTLLQPARGADVSFFATPRAGATPPPACTAADPGQGFQVTVRQASTVLFQGTLAQLLGLHSTAPTAIPYPGRWSSGVRRVVTIAVAMPRDAGNEYMDCPGGFDLRWIAAA
jgi:hypothetical protein